MNGIEVKIVLPPEFLAELKEEVKKAVVEALHENVASIRSQNKKLTREEAKEKLKISLVTLDKHLKGGVIRFERIGKRVLIPESEIENYLKQSA